MFANIFRRGNRLFAASSILILLTAAAHTAGHFSPLPADAKLMAVIEAMTGYQLDLGLGMRPSILSVQESLSLTMSLLLLFLGVQNLATLYWAGDSPRLVRGLAVINLLCMASLSALYLFYQIPPPLICFSLIAVLLLLALILTDKREG
ncbi:MAG TPA: hypothetical protein VGB07_05225 [Blastocatellia bacterium]